MVELVSALVHSPAQVTLPHGIQDPARPLAGVTVLDLTVALAGPIATALLAGLGARVIKIEGPDTLDSSRNNAPYLGIDGVTLTRRHADDISISALNRLRNKLGVTLNLKHPRGRALYGDLVRHADVVVDNFSRGALDRLGVGYDFVRRENPRAIYCSITGFGHDTAGPAKAMDAIIQALSGVMQVSGTADDPPVRVGLPVADLVTPLFAVIGVLSALHMAQRTGCGQHVDISMLGALTSLMAGEAFDVLEDLGIALRTGQTVPRLAPFGVYRTRTGHIALCAPTDTFASGLFRAMKRTELQSDPRFVSRDGRVEHSAELDSLIAQWTREFDSAPLLQLLREHDVPAAEVRHPRDAVRDPRVTARAECVPLSHPTHGATADVLGMGIPIRFSAATAALDRPPPEPGEHNAYVYGELLGYSPHQLAALAAEGAV
jgi:CoA:oxalate CoA-transferase